MSGSFRTTRWSVVARAGSTSGSDAARRALSELCEAYWPPLYAFARRGGTPPEDARDLVQGFFTALVEKNYVADADPERGRFRTFLLAAFRHFCSHERTRERAQKRGGDRPHVDLGLDVTECERLVAPGLTTTETPESHFERQWALTVLRRALEDVRATYRDRGQGAQFDALSPTLSGGTMPPHEALAAELGMSAGAVKVAAHRLRRRYRDALRQEIAGTVDDPADVDAELRALSRALSS